MTGQFSIPSPWISTITGITILMAVMAGTVCAQSGQLPPERRLEELRDQIANEEAALTETERKEQSSLRTLTTLTRQIGMREELVGTYRNRLVELSSERDQLVKTIGVLEDNLGDIKEEYKARATHAYKYGRLYDVALIFSSSSINQMLIRIRYLHRFSEQRREQLAEMYTSTEALKSRRTELQRTLATNEVLISGVRKENVRLGQLREQRQGEVSRLQDQKVGHQQALVEIRSEASELETRIRETLAAATRIRAGNAINEEAYTVLSSSFRQNRGILPWPSSGSIIEPFGDRVNPEFGTKTPNLGILIDTEPSAEVLSVFEGHVALIDIMPEIGRYVIIEHGEYHSVYGNFSMLYIAEGQSVKTGQVIGRSGTDGEPRGHAVFFGLFQDGKPVDPAPWLRK